MTRNIVVTGGAGFIASHLCDHLIAAFPEARLTIVDKLTYAGNLDNLSEVTKSSAVTFLQGDVCDYNLMHKVTKEADWVIHTAAESHVENSFLTPLSFSMTNTMGAHTVIECCRLNNVRKIFHISSDEVYGEIEPPTQANELSALAPTTPYSATKAAADLIIEAYRKTYGLPVTVIRPCNIYGTRQYPEKIIPKFCTLAARCLPLPIQGKGTHTRFYMSVHDLCRAILFIDKNALPADTYNVCSKNEVTNLEIARIICSIFSLDPDSSIEFVADRVYHDKRYAMDDKKLRAYGWSEKNSLSEDIKLIAEWYTTRS